MDPSRDPRAGRGSALAATLRRWLKPPRTLKPTRAGWVFFVLTLGVGFASLNTGNNLLYLVLSLMLAFLVLSGVLSEAALRGIRVKRRLPAELFARGTATVGLEITNDQTRVPSFAVVVEDRLREADGSERGAGRVFALRIDPGATESRYYRLSPPCRGPLELTGFLVYTRFPFGLFSKALRIDEAAETLVYPEVEAVQVPPGFGDARGGGESLAGPGGHGVDVSGLREFATGDPVRRIHWRASARRGELLVREVETEREAEVEVRLPTSDQQPGDGFEQRVSWAASEVLAHLLAGHRVALRTDGEYLPADSGSSQRARLLRFLALVTPGGRRAETPLPEVA